LEALRLGIGGPVGSAKTALVAELCCRLSEDFSIATNDIFTSVLHGDGLEAVAGWVRGAVERCDWTPANSTARPDHHHDLLH
jgi:hypothetical protein